jgi:hypothetical protein
VIGVNAREDFGDDSLASVRGLLSKAENAETLIVCVETVLAVQAPHSEEPILQNHLVPSSILGARRTMPC